MMMSRFARFVVSAAAVLFAAVALFFWLAPEQAAHRFGLRPSGAVGLATLRADLAGLFGGMAMVAAGMVCAPHLVLCGRGDAHRDRLRPNDRLGGERCRWR